MKEQTTTNSQIADAVSQVHNQVLGTAPAFSVASLYQTASHALSNAAHNATSHQQQMNILSQAVTVKCVTMIYGTSMEGATQSITPATTENPA